MYRLLCEAYASFYLVVMNISKAPIFDNTSISEMYFSCFTKDNFLFPLMLIPETWNGRIFYSFGLKVLGNFICSNFDPFGSSCYCMLYIYS